MTAKGDVPDPRLVGAAAMVFVEDPSAPVVGDLDRHHLVDVLRLRAGERVVACDGAGTWVPCRLAGLRLGGGAADGADLLEVDGGPVLEERRSPAITVAFAPVKGDRPEWVVGKLTELGVDRIVPLRTARSVVRWEGERAQRSVERLRRVARESAAQSRRAFLPAVEELTTLEGLAEICGAPPVLARPGGGPPSLSRSVVAVGPEGGWDDHEESAFGEGMGLGPTVLRSETAAVVAACLLCGLRSALVGRLA